MATDFPTSLDAYLRPGATSLMDPTGLSGDVAIDNILDAIEALEAKVGVTSSVVTTSLDYLIKNASARPGHGHILARGAVDVTATFTEVNRLTGVTAGTASASKVLVVDANKDITLGTGDLTATDVNATDVILSNTGVLQFGATTEVQGFYNGWTKSTDTWLYASATSFTIAGVDRTGFYKKGDKLRLKQGGSYKYFYITSVAFAANTTITITGGSDYTLANAGITDNYYSHESTPNGFPDIFNFTASPTGYSGTPTTVATMKLIENEMTLYISISGTSNATTKGFTAPVTSASTITYSGFGFVQTGGVTDTQTYIELPASSTAVSMFLMTVTGATINTSTAWSSAGAVNFKFIFKYLI